MCEFDIVNVKTGESNIIFGYSAKDAFERSKLNPDDYEVVRCEYID